jgi:Necrosis inducing protein (NPP1)
MQPIITWETLTTAAIDTLETYDFGSAIVPFVPATFNDNLAKATF